MKKLTVYFFAMVAMLILFKAGCSDINRSGLQEQVDGIKSVVPAQGPYGARVLIGGDGFTSDPQVLFNGVEAEIESASDSTILTRVPLDASSGPIEVIAGQDILSGPDFTVDSTKTLFLSIDGIRPETGRYRDTIYIAGSGFDPIPEANEVYFNELRASVQNASDSLLLTTVPVGASSGLITVIANQDTAIGPNFELLRHQIVEIDPTSGRIGTQVRITGSDFSDIGSENRVFFNGVRSEILESSSSQIITSVPAEATSGPVSVAVRRDTVEGPAFSVQELQILEVAPISGEVGTDVLISGNGFNPNTNENSIEFNGVSAPVISASETELQTQVPEGATNGPITISVGGLSVTGPEFTIEAGAPVITSVEPLSGAIGDQVTISGSNFSADTSIVTVLFNETESEIIDATETEILTQVPQGAVSGPITVSVNGKTTTGPEFEVITTGTLIVDISTSGSDIDADGYLLTIGAGDGIRTQVNDTVSRSGLKEGTYDILLGDIETNCYLNQDLPNPRTATIEAGATTTVEFYVTCEGVNEPPVASFTVSCTNLTCDLDASESTDPDGSIATFEWILGDGNTGTGQLLSHTYETSGTYSVDLNVTDNEGATNSISQEVTVTIPEITSVSPLSGVPGSIVTILGSNFSSIASENNVQFSGVRAELNSASETELRAIVPSNATTGPITVTVDGYTAQGPEFTVEEVQQPKTLEVVVSTQGTLQDENGYTLSVTGQDDRIVKPNDNVMYSDILENSVQVELTGVAENCVVEGNNPRTVDLNNSDNAGYTEFTITCSAPEPSITSIDPTSGTTGTEVVITGSNFSSTASDNIVEFNGVRAELNGATETELRALVPGTATSGPVTVTVNDITANGPEFTVIQTGSIEVNTLTSGSDLDTDGYTLSIEGLSDQSIGINDTKLLNALPTGSYLVELSGIASNCQLSEELPNPRTLDVSANTTTRTTYSLSCSTPNDPPAAVIESFCLALDCGFTGTSSSDPDGTIVGYDWNYGDGNVASGDSVTHSYTSEGSYEVELTVTDDNGATDTAIKTIDVVLPRITGIDPTSGPVGTEVTITGTGFSDIAGGNTVGFTSGETIIAAELISESTTELIATVPSDATTGPVYVAVGEDYVTEGPVFTVEQPLEPKTLEVSVTTEGPTGDGYTLLVTGQDARFVSANGSTTYTNILENEVSVELSGLGDNCTVDGENPRLVNLNNTDNAGFTAFNVTCTGPAPTIESINPTSGGYGSSVIITGTNFSTTFSENNVQFNGTRAELNSVSTTEIDAIVPWGATSGPVTVTVNGRTATGPDFTIIEPKTLEVITSSTGSDLDSNGYTVSVTGQLQNDIAVNDTLFYSEIFENQVEVELTGVAQNCTVDGNNPRTVNLDNVDNAGSTVFNVNCVSMAPQINNINPTSGATGTEVVITGSNFSSVASDNNVQFNGVRAELNNASETELRAIVPGSATTGPVSVTVNGQTATGPTFTVVTTGTVEINITTSGIDLDPNGYELFLDKDGPTQVGINENHIFSAVQEGSHTVELTDIASNCSISNATANPFPFSISAGETQQINFDITCDQIASVEKILFRGGLNDSEIYMNNPDGSEVVALTKSGSTSVYNPAISNDGTKIAYIQGGDIPSLIVANSDGSNPKSITPETITGPRYPSWSPDGNQLVFVEDKGITKDLFIIDADGSNLTQITKTENLAEDYVHWSPVNDQILFSQRAPSTGNRVLVVMNIDGSNENVITSTPRFYGYGRISPSGKEIIFTDRPGDCFQIFRANIDGTNVRELTSEAELDCAAIDVIDWSPDGNQIVFQSRLGASTYSIRTMPSDGTATSVIISNTPGHPSYLYSPTWGELKQ
jgi:Tol biopolymer transport system component/PKD repeat protein